MSPSTPMMSLALATSLLAFGSASAASPAEYAWCASASLKEATVYYSDVFEVDGLERDVSGQWYGFMQYHFPGADLASARCVIEDRGMSADGARADRDRYVEEMAPLFHATPSRVSTRWTVTPYW
jgi:hypothetical protein